MDSLSIADLHHVIQVLMGWEDDHLHRFRIPWPGLRRRPYRWAYFRRGRRGSATVALRPSERFLIRGIVFSHEAVRDWETKLTRWLRRFAGAIASCRAG